MTFFPWDSTSLFLWGFQPDASELQAPLRLEVHTQCSTSPENMKYCFCISYFLIGKPELGARFTTRPWSPVVQKWTQEIAFSESEPYLITETSLAWCCSPALWMCNLFCGEEVKLRERERNKDIKRESVWSGGLGQGMLWWWCVELSMGWRNCQIRMQQFPFTPWVSSQCDTPWRNLRPSCILVFGLCVEQWVSEETQRGSDGSPVPQIRCWL